MLDRGVISVQKQQEKNKSKKRRKQEKRRKTAAVNFAASRKNLGNSHSASIMVMEEFEWSPSTSTLQAANFTPEGINNFCLNWMKTVKSAEVAMDRPRHTRPSNFIIWAVGLTCVTVISLCAALGILFVKKLSKRAYNHFITVLVAVGVGSLITSSTLHLLPQGLGVVDGENYDFIVVMMFCIFGMYTFFFCDKFIKITLESKKMNEIEMISSAGTHINAEAGVVSIRSTDALITENGSVKRDIPTLEQAKGYKKRTLLRKQSGEGSGTVRSNLDMSKQVVENLII
uniref:Uncharacterized protein n=1 Tax=Setaria digitata TaxID=48799 RepID=A0A915PQ15_9BILA